MEYDRIIKMIKTGDSEMVDLGLMLLLKNYDMDTVLTSFYFCPKGNKFTWGSGEQIHCNKKRAVKLFDEYYIVTYEQIIGIWDSSNIYPAFLVQNLVLYELQQDQDNDILTRSRSGEIRNKVGS